MVPDDKDIIVICVAGVVWIALMLAMVFNLFCFPTAVIEQRMDAQYAQWEQEAREREFDIQEQLKEQQWNKRKKLRREQEREREQRNQPLDPAVEAAGRAQCIEANRDRLPALGALPGQRDTEVEGAAFAQSLWEREVVNDANDSKNVQDVEFAAGQREPDIVATGAVAHYLVMNDAIDVKNVQGVELAAAAAAEQTESDVVAIRAAAHCGMAEVEV